MKNLGQLWVHNVFVSRTGSDKTQEKIGLSSSQLLSPNRLASSSSPHTDTPARLHSTPSRGHGARHCHRDRRGRSCLRLAQPQQLLLAPRGLRLVEQSLARLHVPRLHLATTRAMAPRHLGRRGAPRGRGWGRRLRPRHRDASAWVQCEPRLRCLVNCDYSCESESQFELNLLVTQFGATEAAG